MEKERELAHLQRFKEVCPFFPVGKIENTERPDFVIHTPSGLLGIEHTEIFQPGPPHGGSLQAQESLRDRIVRQAERFYTASGNPPVSVNVLFHPGVEIKRQDVPNVADTLARLVRQAIPFIGESVKLKPTPATWKDFPSHIAFIQVYRDKRRKLSRWDALSIGFVPSIDQKDIQAKIADKESRLSGYRTRCSEVWLLVVADESCVSSTVDPTEGVLEHCYTTGFDRVFLFLNFARWFAQLRTEREGQLLST